MARRLPPLRTIRTFEAAADHESFALAAEALGVTKGAVSQQIKQLEAFLGLPLFARSGRGVRLTDAGRRYHSAVRTALAVLERETERLAGPRGTGQGRALLRLTVLPAFAAMWLIPRLAGFQDEHPRIDIEVSADPEVVDFARSDAHLGIRYGAGAGADLTVVPLGRDRLLPVCSPAYRAARGLERPADLARCRLLHDTFWRDDWYRWWRKSGAAPPEALPNLEEGQHFTLYSMAIEAAKSGLGVAMGHALLVERELAAGTLVAPFAASVPAAERYYLVRPGRSAHLSAVRAFEDWLLGAAGTSLAP